MSLTEENRRNSADFNAERNEYFMRQSLGKKLLVPRLSPSISAKASSEEPEDPEFIEPREDDKQETIKVVLDALASLGDASKHLSEDDKSYIASVCLQDEEPETSSSPVLFIVIALIVGLMLGRLSK